MPGLKIRGLDHVVLRTPQLAAVLHFYRDVLGCPIERTIDAIGLYQLRAGAALIDVIDATVWPGAPAGPGESLYDHFCIALEGDSADEVIAVLDAAGIAHSEPAERYGATGNGISVYATDPDGRTVELKPTGSGA